MEFFLLYGGLKNIIGLAYPVELFVSLDIVGEINVSTQKLLIYAHIWS